MLSDQARPVTAARVDSVSVVARLPGAERRAELPEQVARYARGRERRLLPRALVRAMVRRRSV